MQDPATAITARCTIRGEALLVIKKSGVAAMQSRIQANTSVAAARTTPDGARRSIQRGYTKRKQEVM
jgi:hypothetical protein